MRPRLFNNPLTLLLNNTYCLLLNVVLEHLPVLGVGPNGRVFKNARFLNSRRSFPAARTFTMTMLPVTYGYARVSKADDDAKNLDTQLRLLAGPGIRPELVFTDVASGRTLKRPGWQDLMSCIQPGDTVVSALDRLLRGILLHIPVNKHIEHVILAHEIRLNLVVLP